MTGRASGGAAKAKGFEAPARALLREALGLEAEFTLVLDGVRTPPEQVFGDPRDFLRTPLMHRAGTSYHLPNGGAVYFDTGVVEVVTPAMEIERGVAVRAGRSLWENIEFVRAEMDAWERRAGHRLQLAGFSTHYNVSVDARGLRLERLAKLLTYILPAPVMLLAANRRSTGIGVRPRRTRIEVTADFTPDPALQVATATLIAGIVRQVARWDSTSPPALPAHGVLPIEGFRPCAHTSRHGWLARHDCYPHNPFTSSPDAPLWRLAGEAAPVSLRSIAQRIFAAFRLAIARVADPFTLRLIPAILHGRATSPLDLPDRPATYEDVGRLCRWNAVFPAKFLRRSRYERVLMLAIAGTPLTIDGRRYRPTGMRGWSEVILREEGTGTRRILTVDALVGRLGEWGG